jgi:uncharacterized protein (DUF433 family)
VSSTLIYGTRWYGDRGGGGLVVSDPGTDLRYTAGLLNLQAAGRYLKVPQPTFYRWARGYKRGEPLIHVKPRSIDDLPVTFIALAEGYVLDALKAAGVRPNKIRPALDSLREEFGEYVLVAKELATDGIDVLWDYAQTDAGHELIAGHTRQTVIREIVTDYMRYVIRDSAGYPETLILRNWEPVRVVVDMRRSFGQPVFEETGTPVAAVAGMMKAGEDAESAAEEFGVTVDDARTAARILLGQAA